MTAFRATYSDWKLVKTRGVVQVIFEVPLADHDVAYQVVGGMPDASKERWFAIAPLKPPAKETNVKLIAAPPHPVTPPLVEAKRTWNDFPPAKQAGIRSHDIRFEHFLEEEYQDVWSRTPHAAVCIRTICNVSSRSELSADHSKRVLWNQLDKHFQAWKAKIRMNA